MSILNPEASGILLEYYSAPEEKGNKVRNVCSPQSRFWKQQQMQNFLAPGTNIEYYEASEQLFKLLLAAHTYAHITCMKFFKERNTWAAIGENSHTPINFDVFIIMEGKFNA